MPLQTCLSPIFAVFESLYLIQYSVGPKDLNILPNKFHDNLECLESIIKGIMLMKINVNNGITWVPLLERKYNNCSTWTGCVLV